METKQKMVRVEMMVIQTFAQQNHLTVEHTLKSRVHSKSILKQETRKRKKQYSKYTAKKKKTKAGKRISVAMTVMTVMTVTAQQLH